MSVSRVASRVLIAGGVIVLAGCGDSQSEAASQAEVRPPPAPASVTDPASMGLPNPNPTVVKEWGPLPDGRTWGSTAGVDIDPHDGHVWAYDRCGGVGLAGGCDDNLVDPVFKFDRETGEVLASFGAGLFVLPHGIHVDRGGNVWIVDMQGNEERTKGHQVVKFSPDGRVLLTLGTPGVPGDGPDHFNQPNDVITAPNGDIFVADGHGGQGFLTPQNPAVPEGATGRIMKFTADGDFIKEWGQIGTGPGDFRTPHALAFDSQGRLFVADRGNHRIQIFDQDGNYLDAYVQFGRVSGLFITDDDMLYAIDSESSPASHPDWSTGIRIGHVSEDRVTAFIPPHETGEPHGAAGEGVAVDRAGNVYAAEGPISRPTAGGGLTKYIRR